VDLKFSHIDLVSIASAVSHVPRRPARRERDVRPCLAEASS
jgi:hypothetical protein